MKKLLLSLFSILAVMSLSAATVTVDCTSLTWDGVAEKAQTISATSQGFTISITKDKGATNPTQNGTTKDIRAYAGNIITITSTSGAISQAVFELSAAGVKRLSSGNTTSTGTIVSNATDKTVTWNGSAATFDVTVGASADLGTDGAAKAGQLDFNSIVFTTGGAVTTVSNPVFTPAAGTYYEAQSVSIACATEGATIKYSIDGGAETEYTAPINVSATSTIMAQASKSGLTSSEIVEATYTILAAKKVENIAAFLASNTTGTATGEVLEFANPVTVTYYGESGTATPPNCYLFVKDESGVMQIYSKAANFPHAYKNGDVIPAGIKGSVAFYGKQPQMTPSMDSFQAATAGAAVEPKTVTAAEITADMNNEYVLIDNATITANETKFYVGAVQVYDRFNGVAKTSSLDLTKTYKLAGIVTMYNTTLEIFPTDFNYLSGVANEVIDGAVTTVKAIAGAININAQDAAQVMVINAAGQVVAQQAIQAGESTINVATGFYIVKVGNKVAKVIVK